MVGGCVSSGLLWIGYVLVFPETPNHLPNVKEWGWILILAWVCTVYAYSAGVGLLRKISPFTFNLTVNLEPVYGIVLAFLIFGESEKMTLGFYIGTVIILAAVVCYPVFKRD
jgi:drug/metabolite transporter (DMT)-like permease